MQLSGTIQGIQMARKPSAMRVERPGAAEAALIAVGTVFAADLLAQTLPSGDTLADRRARADYTLATDGPSQTTPTADTPPGLE